MLVTIRVFTDAKIDHEIPPDDTDVGRCETLNFLATLFERERSKKALFVVFRKGR